MTSATVPPRFVPTLTDVVHSVDRLSPKPPAGETQQSAAGLEDQIVHRIMQRVELVLERRLREAVAQVILSHTQSLEPRLRGEIDRVLRESVSEALAQELPPGSA